MAFYLLHNYMDFIKISQKKEILDLDVDYTNDITYHPFEEEILKLK